MRNDCGRPIPSHPAPFAVTDVDKNKRNTPSTDTSRHRRRTPHAAQIIAAEENSKVYKRFVAGAAAVAPNQTAASAAITAKLKNMTAAELSAQGAEFKVLPNLAVEPLCLRA